MMKRAKLDAYVGGYNRSVPPRRRMLEQELFL